jgi:hypothetical protein
MSQYATETGVIENALFTILMSNTWNKRLLVHCHGCRPEGIPLDATIDEEDLLYLELLSQGYFIAMTSYRREGRILMEGVEDVRYCLWM